MSSKRAIRRRQCKGKVRHESAQSAQNAGAAIGSLLKSGRAERGMLNAYRCSFCGGYHVGHRKGSGLRAA